MVRVTEHRTRSIKSSLSRMLSHLRTSNIFPIMFQIFRNYIMNVKHSIQHTELFSLRYPFGVDLISNFCHWLQRKDGELQLVTRASVRPRPQMTGCAYHLIYANVLRPSININPSAISQWRVNIRNHTSPFLP